MECLNVWVWIITYWKYLYPYLCKWIKSLYKVDCQLSTIKRNTWIVKLITLMASLESGTREAAAAQCRSPLIIVIGFICQILIMFWHLHNGNLTCEDAEVGRYTSLPFLSLFYLTLLYLSKYFVFLFFIYYRFLFLCK